ncbi:MAG: formyltetrahydrofolate deformylase [Nitriliruptoraceae bacterium]
MPRFVLTLRCPDRPGIVRGLASGVFSIDGNIVDSSQFSDVTTGGFFMRMEFDAPDVNGDEVHTHLAAELAEFDPELTIRPQEQRRRALVMVSKQDHCLVDLLYRTGLGELPVDIPLVVSNHETTRATVEAHGIPFVHLPVSTDTKPEAERQLRELVEEHDIDFIVLARYMQIVSDETCEALYGRIINIHHSFLPAFKGAKPYHQAFDRGVKVIGATAHYVTADLDEGPIIHQDVAHVNHAVGPDDLVVIGRDIERLVLARAVRLHAEDRVLLNGHRTVVFD